MMEGLSELLGEFIAESQDILARVKENLSDYLSSSDKAERLKDIARGIHTVKGSSSMFELKELSQRAHKLESYLLQYKDHPEKLGERQIQSILKFVSIIEDMIEAAAPGNKPQTPITPQTEKEPVKETITHAAPVSELVRVHLDRLEKAMETVTEIFLVRNQMSFLVDKLLKKEGDISSFLQEWDALDNGMRKSIGDLEHTVMGMRMTPIKNLFQRMSKAVDSYLDTSSKKIVLRTDGESTELDKKVLDHLNEPLIHLIRNAMDHGIEDPARRLELGKPEYGTITLSAEVRGNEVLITIKDDGKGIDGDAILESAKKKGLDVSNVTSKEQAINLIFLPGFSTAEAVSEVSGRGVGMDAVKTFVEELGGHVKVETEIGKGSTFSLALPLGMSLVPSILVRVNDIVYAFPSSEVLETAKVPITSFMHNDSERFVKYKDELLRCYFLSDYFEDLAKDERLKIIDSHVPICVVKLEDEIVAICISEFISNTEIALKPLPYHCPSLTYLSGASVLATGEPILVFSTKRLCAALRSNSKATTNAAA